MHLPIRVAEVHLSINILAYSPLVRLTAGKTTTLFCEVRPDKNSTDLFENPSIKTSKTIPISFFFDLAESLF